MELSQYNPLIPGNMQQNDMGILFYGTAGSSMSSTTINCLKVRAFNTTAIQPITPNPWACQVSRANSSWIEVNADVGSSLESSTGFSWNSTMNIHGWLLLNTTFTYTGTPGYINLWYGAWEDEVIDIQIAVQNLP